jgi:hydrogenase maturation protease
MPNILIIGYGNPLRGDDGVGIRAAELLAGEGGENPPLPHGVEVIACPQLSVELAAAITEAERLILIDACADGEPGALREQPLTPIIPDSSSLSHHLDARGLLAAAQILYGKAPPTILFTISGRDFDYREQLSPPVAAALPALLARIRDALFANPTDRVVERGHGARRAA